MSRVETAMGELVARYVQLELGTTYDPPDPAGAERLRGAIKGYQAQRKAGTLDAEAFVAWACGEVPWLARQLGDVPAPPRPTWTPPPPVRPTGARARRAARWRATAPRR